jgi:hypothetical protein
VNTSVVEKSRVKSSADGGDLGVRTLTLFFQNVSGILLERTETGIRGWLREKHTRKIGAAARFFRCRVNCEQVPLLPAEAVARILGKSAKDSVPGEIKPVSGLMVVTGTLLYAR